MRRSRFYLSNKLNLTVSKDNVDMSSGQVNRTPKKKQNGRQERLICSSRAFWASSSWYDSHVFRRHCIPFTSTFHTLHTGNWRSGNWRPYGWIDTVKRQGLETMLFDAPICELKEAFHRLVLRDLSEERKTFSEAPLHLKAKGLRKLESFKPR